MLWVFSPPFLPNETLEIEKTFPVLEVIKTLALFEPERFWKVY